MLVVACVGAIGAGLAATAACSKSVKGEAYGLVHGAGYVGYATVTIDKVDQEKGMVKNVTLTEYCFPTQVPKTAKTDEAPATYYEEVKYGEVTMTYDADAATYMVGTQTIKEYFATPANCKAYVEAVNAGKVSVTVNGTADYSVMTKAALCKDYNGYWTRQDADGKDYSRWAWNRDNTVNYVKKNGVAALMGTTHDKSDKDPFNPEGNNVNYWQDATGVSTGATWNDLNDLAKAANGGYYSYSMLIATAWTNAALELDPDLANGN